MKILMLLILTTTLSACNETYTQNLLVECYNKAGDLVYKDIHTEIHFSSGNNTDTNARHKCIIQPEVK